MPILNALRDRDPDENYQYNNLTTVVRILRTV